MERRGEGNEQFGSNSIQAKVTHVPSERVITSLRAWLEVGDVMSREMVTISVEETVVSAAKMMSENNVSCILALDDAKVAGILTETDLLKRIADKKNNFDTTRVAEIMSSPVETVSPHVSVLEASKLMERKQIKRLPIVDGQRLLGIVTQTDLVRVLTSYGMWRDIAEVMSTDVAAIDKEATVAEAAELMTSRNISCIVVLQGHQPEGVLTERDLLTRVVAMHRDPAQVKTGEVMSSPVITVPPHYSIFSVGKIMDAMSIRRLVVAEDGRLCGIVAQTDIFRAVKTKLQKEEEKNLSLLEESESSIYTIDLDGKTTYVNPAFARLFEVSDPKELIGRPFLPEPFWPDPAERARFFKRLRKGGTGIRELALKTSQGKRIYVTLFRTFTKNMQGEINGSQGVVYDITAKTELVTLRKTEEALRESERRYRLLAENAKDVIWTADLKLRWTYISPSIELLRGFTAKESMAQTVEETMTPASAELARKTLAEELASAEQAGDAPTRTRTLEVELTCRDGSTVWTEVKVSFLCEEDNRPLGLLGVVRDISERKKTAQKLQDYALALESANVALERSYQTAEAAARAKGEFLANMSHEIRTPLTAILGYTDLLMTARLGDEERDSHLQTIHRNGEILLELINDILDLSKIEADRMTVKQSDCSPWRIVEDVISLMQLQADRKGLGIVVDYAFPLPQTIRTDPVRLRQILLNLVGNAIKFTDEGMLRIAACCEPSPDCGPRVRFSVTDTGIGITPEQMSNLFQPFFQADGTTTRRFGGTGLGLTISKRLAQMLGGDIEVQSQPGRGSTFTVTIDPGPLDAVPMLEAPPDVPAEDPGPRPAYRDQTPGGRVLLAEDGPDNQRLIRFLLEEAGLDVDLAPNGRIACEKAWDSHARGCPYHLILMDIQMPELDGYGATQRLRHHGWRGPILALTAYAMADDREKCLKIGCDDYVTKPIDRAKLLDTVMHHLARARTIARPCEAPPTLAGPR